MLTAEGSQSVPGGAGDEEAHVVQRPPGTGLWPGLSRALRRRRLGLGLRRLRGALATAQLSAHVLQEERPIRCGPATHQPCPAPPRWGPPLTSHRGFRTSGRNGPSAGLRCPLARTAASEGTGVLTSRRTNHAP